MKEFEKLSRIIENNINTELKELYDIVESFIYLNFQYELQSYNAYSYLCKNVRDFVIENSKKLELIKNSKVLFEADGFILKRG